MLADRRIARDKSRTRQRLMLPHPGMVFLIIEKRRQRAYQQAAVAVGPQPQIGFIQLPGGCNAGEPGVDALRETGVIFRRFIGAFLV